MYNMSFFLSNFLSIVHITLVLDGVLIMSTKVSKAYIAMYYSFFNKTCMLINSVGWRLSETINLMRNNIPGDIEDISLRRGKNI